ncbi:MAG: dihydroxyacetone kinase subunit DhaK [Spirochaetaceae bacterium]|nr:dihydroxyacetone kinase subunit DhaK [Spirochaetaceae bacterium]
MNKTKVSLLSGGGYDSIHTGCIGRDIFDVVVCGDVFASPAGTSIRIPIKASIGDWGMLLQNNITSFPVQPLQINLRINQFFKPYQPRLNRQHL